MCGKVSHLLENGAIQGVVSHHKHLKLTLSLQICVHNFYTFGYKITAFTFLDCHSTVPLLHLGQYIECEIKLYKRLCYLCNKLDTKERVEGGAWVGR
jgi:hypothetical protein